MAGELNTGRVGGWGGGVGRVGMRGEVSTGAWNVRCKGGGGGGQQE